GEITYTIIYQKHFFFSEALISYQKDTIKKKKDSSIEYPTVERSQLGEYRQSLQLFLKSRLSKSDLTKKRILEKKNMKMRAMDRKMECGTLVTKSNEDSKIFGKEYHPQTSNRIGMEEQLEILEEKEKEEWSKMIEKSQMNGRVEI
ncbi:hypothetical protein RFI_25222, partial [Reticulomyxa filosa]